MRPNVRLINTYLTRSKVNGQMQATKKVQPEQTIDSAARR